MRWEVVLLHLSNVLVGGTGTAYAVFRYFTKPSGEFDVVNHPLQPAVQHLHLLLAPLLVFAVGLAWRTHAVAHLRREGAPRRRTGLSLLVAFVPMAASGYLLQTAVDPAWRRAWIAVHLATSVLWIAGYLAHQLGKRGSERVRSEG